MLQSQIFFVCQSFYYNSIVMYSQLQPTFFNPYVDIALLLSILLFSLISFILPVIYYIKRECRQHPTVLLANISLLEAVANFNVLLMAYNLYDFERTIHIKQVFHFLTFNIDFLPTEDSFCVYNYCIYMTLQLLSLSFHISYSVDLFLTLKFPFLNGKKRRKYYYAFSVFFLAATLVNSVREAQGIIFVYSGICLQEISKQSIYKVPLFFLIALTFFCVFSIVVIFMSFFHGKGRSQIRANYIRQHRIVLVILVILWICPILLNYLILLDKEDVDWFQQLNVTSFFCLVTSSGLVTVYRIASDPYLRKRTKALFRKQSTIASVDPDQQQQQNKQKSVNQQVWNLPLAGAMNEFQSQQVVHCIIQIVSQVCSQQKVHQSRMTLGASRNSLYQSILPGMNTIVVEMNCQKVDSSLTNLFRKRQQEKLSKLDPYQCGVEQLHHVCKRTRHFNMVWLAPIEKPHSQNLISRLTQKTVHINEQSALKSKAADQQIVSQILDIKVTSYCHRVFESLRKLDGLSAERIAMSLNLQKNIQSIQKAKQSLGASGSFFFFSSDNLLVIKTISQQQKDRLIHILPHYYDHIRYNDNSLLARTYGAFSVQIAGISKIYFTLMQNTFRHFEDKSIKYRIYDMKGSTVQREVKNTKNAPVLKDINFFKSKDCFVFMTPSDREQFLTQISRDIRMLQKHNIMDYSLLLGVGNSKTLRQIPLNKRENQTQNWRYVSNLQQISRRVYSVSVIDYLQEFNMSKKMELMMKKMFKGGGDISSINTEAYFKRFMQFLEKIVVPMHLPNQ